MLFRVSLKATYRGTAPTFRFDRPLSKPKAPRFKVTVPQLLCTQRSTRTRRNKHPLRKWWLWVCGLCTCAAKHTSGMIQNSNCSKTANTVGKVADKTDGNGGQICRRSTACLPTYLSRYILVLSSNQRVGILEVMASLQKNVNHSSIFKYLYFRVGEPLVTC